MAIRNILLGGSSDWNRNEIQLAEDLNDTFDAAASLITGEDLWDRTGTDTTLKNTGDNVGIGTTSPDEKLHIVGDVNAGFGLKIENTNAGGSAAANLWLYDDTGNSRIYHTGGKLNVRNEFTGGDISLRTTNGENLVIDGATGNVGIGTTSPGAKLELEFTSGIGLLLTNNGGSDNCFNIDQDRLNHGSSQDWNTAQIVRTNIGSSTGVTTGALLYLENEFTKSDTHADNTTILEMVQHADATGALISLSSPDIEVIDFDACTDGGTSHTTVAGSLKVQMPDGTTGYINFYT